MEANKLRNNVGKTLNVHINKNLGWNIAYVKSHVRNKKPDYNSIRQSIKYDYTNFIKYNNKWDTNIIRTVKNAWKKLMKLRVNIDKTIKKKTENGNDTIKA